MNQNLVCCVITMRCFNLFRVCVTLLVTAGIAFIQVYLPHLNQIPYFIIPTYVAAGLVLLWMFPIIAKALSERPLWITDLEQFEYDNEAERRKFQVIYIHLYNVFLAITVGVVAQYAVYRIMHTEYTYTEVVGVAGGLFTLFMKAAHASNKFLIHMIYHQKRQRRKSTKASLMENLDVGFSDIELP